MQTTMSICRNKTHLYYTRVLFTVLLLYKVYIQIISPMYYILTFAVLCVQNSQVFFHSYISILFLIYLYLLLFYYTMCFLYICFETLKVSIKINFV